MDKLIARALSFAAHKHRHQQRKSSDNIPYINHPLELVEVMIVEADIADVHAICAAILHDTVEDTDASHQEIEEIFGSQIAAIVMEVTDDKTLPKAMRKQAQIDMAPHASYHAKLVKLADKIVNIRDMSDRPPYNWSLDRRLKYLDWSEKVVNALRGTHDVLESIFDESLQRSRQNLKAAEKVSKP